MIEHSGIVQILVAIGGVVVYLENRVFPRELNLLVWWFLKKRLEMSCFEKVMRRCFLLLDCFVALERLHVCLDLLLRLLAHCNSREVCPFLFVYCG